MSTHDEHTGSRIRIRLYEESDREFLLGLAPRLATGLAQWRAPQKMEAAALRWSGEGIAGMDERSTGVIAEGANGARAGVATGGTPLPVTRPARGDLAE